MSAVLHRATREITADTDQRIALDATGLPFPEVVENGMAFDARLWPFESLCGPGIPVSEIKFGERR